MMQTDNKDYYKILRWMQRELNANYSDYVITLECGELSATALAEAAIVDGVASDDAWADETHTVWDAAVDVIELLARSNPY